MAKQSKAKTVARKAPAPRCQVIADAGIETGKDFAKLMSALIGDIAAGRINHGAANAICNAGGKLLRIVELQHRYGGPKNQEEKSLKLAPPIGKQPNG